MFRILKDLLFGNRQTIKHRQGGVELTRSLAHNTQVFKNIFANDGTVMYRNFETRDGVPCLLVFVDGMVNNAMLHDDILLRVMETTMADVPKGKRLSFLMDKVITTSVMKIQSDLDTIITEMLYGDTLLLMEGAAEAMIISTKGWKTRSVEEPESEKVVRGPREGFTESIEVNTTLIRRRVKNPKLRFEYQKLGLRTKTNICICYLEDLASPAILQELKERISKIELDGVLESGYIEELIKDSPLTPFKTVGFTERPDIAAARLLEGRFVVLCDNTPFVLTLPFLFLENFQANEDYYRNYYIASAYRLFRYLAFFLTVSTPAVYLSIVTYHQEMIPTPLLLSISAARSGIPFPTVLEAVVLGLVFEMLREGGVRLPSPIGQAVSIVGAIVLGDAAVNARIVSAPMIIVTALTGISSFLIPSMLGISLLLRLVLLFLASFFGLFGYMFGVIGLFIQLFSMRSFGIPFMMSWGSVNAGEVKDTALRAPWWYMKTRPNLIGKRDIDRQPEKTLMERRQSHD